MHEDQERASVSTTEKKYPYIEKWIFGGGRIELGQSDYTPALALALDEGGIIWEGEARYETLDAMLAALEAGIAAWSEENQ